MSLHKQVFVFIRARVLKIEDYMLQLSQKLDFYIKFITRNISKQRGEYSPAQAALIYILL